MNKRVAIYVRQSHELQEGIDRGLYECRQLVADHEDWTLVAELIDNGKSAWKPGKRDDRSDWAKLNLMAARKEIDIVVSVNMDRLLRQMSDLVTLYATGVHIQTVDGYLDMSTAEGRRNAQSAASAAEFESARKSERQIRAAAGRARAGVPITGRRPFGFQNDRMTPHPVEAEIVRGIYKDFLSGVSLHAIARGLNSAGILSTMGKPFTTVSLRHVLRRPANAGIMTRHGERMSESKITPLVSEDEWSEVVAQLAGRSEPSGPKVSASLLTNIMTCTCGAPMIGKTVHRKGEAERVRTYICKTKAYPDSITTGQHVTIVAAIADDVVTTAVLDAVMDGTLGAPTEDESEEIRKTRVQLAELAADRASATDALMVRGADKTRVMARLAEIDRETERLTGYRDALVAARAGGSAFAEFRAHFANGLTDDPAADAAVYDVASAAWEDFDLDKKRDIIRGGFNVTLKAGGKGAKRVECVPV